MNQGSKAQDKKNETLDIEELNWTTEVADQTGEAGTSSCQFENISAINGGKDSPNRKSGRGGTTFIDNEHILEDLCAKENSNRVLNMKRPVSGSNFQKNNIDKGISKDESNLVIGCEKERTKSFSSTRELVKGPSSVQKPADATKTQLTPKSEFNQTCTNHFFKRKDGENFQKTNSPTIQQNRQKSSESKNQEKITNFFMETKRKRMTDHKLNLENMIDTNIEHIGSVFKSRHQSNQAIKKPAATGLTGTSRIKGSVQAMDKSKEKTSSNKGSTATSRHQSKEIKFETGGYSTPNDAPIDRKGDSSEKKQTTSHYPNYEQLKSSLINSFKNKPSLVSDDFSSTKNISDQMKMKDDLIESLQRQLDYRTNQYQVISC